MLNMSEIGRRGGGGVSMDTSVASAECFWFIEFHLFGEVQTWRSCRVLVGSAH